MCEGEDHRDLLGTVPSGYSRYGPAVRSICKLSVFKLNSEKKKKTLSFCAFSLELDYKLRLSRTDVAR